MFLFEIALPYRDIHDAGGVVRYIERAFPRWRAIDEVLDPVMCVSRVTVLAKWGRKQGNVFYN